MVNIRNVSPVGDLDVPLLGRLVKRGEVVEVSLEHAQRLLRQNDVWHVVGPSGDPSQRPSNNAKKAVWIAHAEHLGVEGAEDMTKPELMAATTPAVVDGDGVLGVGEDGIPLLHAAGEGDSGEANDSSDAGSDPSETKGE
ncbi:hypothetical protein LGT39_12430 [Demequina sp. TTPB684]|uniref:hypothetical protein n=1 Tax=unclassified Demequina TaxID=2620311 RepID=UPI001CF4ECA6|nr:MULTISPECIES: hypothetical protein [unclassified Demequina]MCB2413651.1 hypothetical protein [Demequina sp. TTPB684]UPU87714.1 hypothetical protein LGT36_010685 [Demequina sp. TMPB413]